MRKKYTSEEILKMAVKNAGVDPNADLNADARVNEEDARLAERGDTQTSGGPRYAPDETLARAREQVLSQLMEQNASGPRVNAERLYAQYRDLYSQNAARAAEHAYGLASAHTGGYGSSYASGAANAAYNGVMEGLADRAAEVSALEMKQRQADSDARYRLLDALNGLEQNDYSRYTDALSLAFRAAEQGDYGLLEDMDIDTSALRRADVAALAETAAKYGDPSYLGAMGINTSALTRQQAMEQAAAAAGYGDYGYLEALGVDTAQAQYERLLKTAAKAAEYGDLSELEALGVNVEDLRRRDRLEEALALAQYGDYALLGSFSENLSGLRQKVSVTVQKGAEAAYAAGGTAGLIRYLNRQMDYGQINEAAKRQILLALTGGGYGG